MMTARERWLAALQMQPVDRLPFWPKLNQAYPPAQVSPFREMSLSDLHQWIGSDQHAWLKGCIRYRRTVTSLEEQREGDLNRTLYRSPHGVLQATDSWDETARSWHPIEFPIKSAEDLAVMTEWYADGHPELDTDALASVRNQTAAIGDAAVTTCSIGTSPLMYFVEHLAGIENAHYFLADDPEGVEALFEAMHRHLLAETELMAAHHPADLLYFIENTSTTLISPEQYRTFNLPHLREYAEVGKSANRLVALHMCGHLKELLPDLATLPVSAFEAVTSPTLGNTTLLDGRSVCPDTCLIGGTNAMLWLCSPEEIIAKIEEDLSELPYHRGIVLTSAGVMPPFCPPEVIKTVCDWVKQYPVRM